MDINAISRDSVLTTVTPVVPPEQAAENREVIQAVKAVNAADLLGRENELVFQLDQRTHKLLVRLVSRQTGEVVSQYPPEYVLRMAEDLK